MHVVAVMVAIVAVAVVAVAAAVTTMMMMGDDGTHLALDVAAVEAAAVSTVGVVGLLLRPLLVSVVMAVALDYRDLKHEPLNR